jgi:hypothetical protein
VKLLSDNHISFNGNDKRQNTITAQKPKLSLHSKRSISTEITKDKILHFSIPRLFILVMLQMKPETGLKQVFIQN